MSEGKQDLRLKLAKARERLEHAQACVADLEAALVKDQVTSTNVQANDDHYPHALDIDDVTDGVSNFSGAGSHYHVFDDLLEGAEIIGFDWHFLYVNNAAASHGRQSREVLLHSSVLELYPGIEQTTLFAGLRTCMEERIPQHFENDFIFPDGETAWFELSVQPIPEGIFILSLDITERKKTENTLKRYAERMEILHQIDIGIISAHSVREIVEKALKHIRLLFACQQAGVSLLDFKTNEIVIFAADQSAPIGNIVGSRHPMMAEYLEGLGESGVAVVNDIQLLPASSQRRQHMESQGTRSALRAILTFQGHPVGILGLAADTPNYFTTELQETAVEIANQFAIAVKHMELSTALEQHTAALEQKVMERTAELSAAKERIEAIFNNSTDGILLVHTDLNIQQTNSSFNRLFGCARDDYFGKSLLRLMQAENAATVTALIQTVAEERQGQSIEIRALRKDGMVFDAELSLGAMKGNGLVCTIRDITERKRAEEAIHAKVKEEREFQSYLKALHQITIELTQVDQLDTFYKQAVVLGHERLGFERLAMFLYDENGGSVRGTVGTDSQGNIVDERHIQFVPDPNGIMMRAFQETERFYYQTEATLYSDNKPCGVGWNAGAVLWNGTRSMGWLIADNLISQTPASKPLLDILGLYALTVGTLLAQKQAQIALRESEKLYRLLADSINDVVIRFNVNMAYLYVSPSSRAILGYEPAELLGPSDFRRIHPDDVPAIQALIRGLVENPDRTSITYRFLHKQGHYIWLESSGQAVVSEQTGEVVEFVFSGRDITKRKKIEEALRESEERFRQIAENFDQILFMRSGDNQTLLYINPRYEVMWGKTREYLYANPNSFVEPIHPDDMEFVRQQFTSKRYLEEGIADFEYRFVLADQLVHWVRVRMFPIKSEAGVILRRVGIIEDITERKKAEEVLRRAYEKEKELGELKSRFVSMASHEFRTPLATILALTETLSVYRHKMTEEQIEQRYTKIKEQIGHLVDIMDDVLLIAKMQARRVNFNAVMLDLDALCQSVIEEFQSRPDIHHQLVFTHDGPVREHKLDAKLMRQIISNLLSNAIKYSPSDKPVTLQLKFTSKAIECSVSDQGIGIPENDLKHLFEPFHRADNVGSISGTGLGLTITKDSVEMHGGTIEVESHVGIGTTFTVHIPLNSEE